MVRSHLYLNRNNSASGADTTPEVIFLIRKRGEHGIVILTAMFFVFFTVLILHYFSIAFEQKYVSAADERSELKICAAETNGTIFDRDLRPLNNSQRIYQAVIVPKSADKDVYICYALDKEKFSADFDNGEPFVFSCAEDTPESDAVTVFSVPQRYSENQLAQHIIGYTSDGKGVSGVEEAYSSILHSAGSENSVSYSIDGFGRVLMGDGKNVVNSKADEAGVVTAIDSDVQRICEKYGKSCGRGAIVIAEIETGDILGMASFPDYSADDLESAIKDERSPLINRCLCSYSVGSIFKLVTACEAIEEGKSYYDYECKGCINVDGQRFNCHQLAGHGAQSMSKAMTNSCNTYFISLSRELDVKSFREKAYELGFGKETYLCESMIGSAGVLPTARQLDIPAEMANFSCGQGKLTATPLQITQLICAIAGGGQMPVLRLIKGITIDGKTIANEKTPQLSRVFEKHTAEQLRQMMISAIRDNKESNARSDIVSVGAKTSTAQTGRFGEDGEELCHAWISGFFPADSPKYALTVLVEDGGYGNKSAAPIFIKIAEEVTKLKR